MAMMVGRKSWGICASRLSHMVAVRPAQRHPYLPVVINSIIVRSKRNFMISCGCLRVICRRGVWFGFSRVARATERCLQPDTSRTIRDYIEASPYSEVNVDDNTGYSEGSSVFSFGLGTFLIAANAPAAFPTPPRPETSDSAHFGKSRAGKSNQRLRRPYHGIMWLP
jgi:hypothetical protein